MTQIDIIAHVRSVLANAGFLVGPVKEIQYGVQFTVTKGNFSRFIRVYHSAKKGYTVDISQIGSCDTARQIQDILSRAAEYPGDDKPQDISSPLVGCDESGKGDYFGPLVTAAVYIGSLKEEQFLWQVGVRDCKALSNERVLELAVQIKRLGQTNYCITTLHPSLYNSQYEQIMNLNVLLARAHASTIESLLENKFGKNAFHAFNKDLPASITVLVDQFASDENVLRENMLSMGNMTNLVQRTKAESNIAVAAASILARAEFLTQLRQLSENHNISFPAGSTNVVDAARCFVEQEGMDQLGNVAKIHFKTTMEVVLTH